MAVDGVLGPAFTLVAPVQDHLLELVPEEVIHIIFNYVSAGAMP